MQEIKTGIYIIDADDRLISFNAACKAFYPALEVGKRCYEALMGREQPCPQCPIRQSLSEQRTYFDEARTAFVMIDHTELTLPGYGLCHEMIFSVAPAADVSDRPMYSDAAHAYQQSMDILDSLVADLLGAGIIDLSDGSFTVLKDQSDRTVVRHRHMYASYFYEQLQPVIRPESAEGLRLADLSYLAERLKREGRVCFDFHLKKGSWLRCVWQTLRNADGETPRILLYSTDATETYEGASQVSEMLKRQEAIIQGLGEVYYSVLLVDYDRDRVTVYRHEDEDGRDIADYFAKYDFRWSAGIEQYCTDLVAEGSGETLRQALSLENLQKAREGFSVNYQKKTKEGLRYLEARVAFAEKSDGSRVAIVGTRSVEDTVRSEQTLRVRLQMIAAAVSKIYPMVAEINLTQNHYQIAAYAEFVNKTAATEGTLDEFIKVGASTIPAPDEAVAFLRLFRRQAQIDAFRRGEQELVLRHQQTGDDGAVHWMETRVIFVAGEDGDMRGIALSRPIDQEIRVSKELAQAKDAAEAANRAKSTFLFNMSHDIRTPMNAIVGFAELALRHQNDPAKLGGYLRKIQASSDYMLKLVNSVLEMARIERGTIMLDLEPARLTEVCGDALMLFEEEAAQKQLSYHYTLGFDPIMVNIDRIRVEEILSNVVSNAIKYTDKGGAVEVSVRLNKQAENRYEMTAVVTDTGIGMSKDFLPNIFTSFTRERTQQTNDIQGTGLGMGITKRLVDIMGGSIEIESVLGVGTTVTITLPFERVTTPDEYKENMRAEDLAEQLRAKRLLLAEDNDLNAEIAMEIFTQAGLYVERAADGVACVSMLCQAAPHYYDAILMDIQMPNLNGYLATRKIRRLDDPEKASIPIIAMTANTFEEDRRKALDSGMDGFVPKPIEIDKLFETLAEIIPS